MKYHSWTIGDLLLIAGLIFATLVVVAFASDMVWHWGPWW